MVLVLAPTMSVLSIVARRTGGPGSRSAGSKKGAKPNPFGLPGRKTTTPARRGTAKKTPAKKTPAKKTPAKRGSIGIKKSPPKKGSIGIKKRGTGKETAKKPGFTFPSLSSGTAQVSAKDKPKAQLSFSTQRKAPPQPTKPAVAPLSEEDLNTLLTVGAIGFGAALLVVNGQALIEGAFQTIGFMYSCYFAWRNLIFEDDREQLQKDIALVTEKTGLAEIDVGTFVDNVASTVKTSAQGASDDSIVYGFGAEEKKEAEKKEA